MKVGLRNDSGGDCSVSIKHYTRTEKLNGIKHNICSTGAFAVFDSTFQKQVLSDGIVKVRISPTYCEIGLCSTVEGSTLVVTTY